MVQVEKSANRFFYLHGVNGHITAERLTADANAVTITCTSPYFPGRVLLVEVVKRKDSCYVVGYEIRTDNGTIEQPFSVPLPGPTVQEVVTAIINDSFRGRIGI